MSLPDISSIYRIMNWHKDRTEKNKDVGVFIPIPADLSKQFPENAQDTSPKHITLLYIGNVNPLFENKLKEVVQTVCQQFRPFKIKIGKKQRRFFDNNGDKTSHFPIFSRKLKEFNSVLRQELLRNHIAVDSKHPEYNPHITVEKIKEGERPKFKKLKFEENQVMTVEHIWIWRRF